MNNDRSLPASGSFSYYLWLSVNNDSAFKARKDTAKYVLDFLDTTGTFVCRLDSVMLFDTTTGFGPSVRTKTISRSSAIRGTVSFHRLSPVLDPAGGLWSDFVTIDRLSTVGSGKRGQPNIEPKTSALISAVPNPLRSETQINFAIPRDGFVTLEVFDVLGRRVASMAEHRLFRAGRHALIWKAGSVPNGTYLVVLRYGNQVITQHMEVVR